MKTRKPRGSYASLICLRCRARKIKCVLPDDAVQPSEHPLRPELACHRCRQNGFDCVVDSTTLGRPACKRQRISTESDEKISHVHIAEPSGMDDFILSHPWDLEKSSGAALSGEVIESLFGPMHLLYALLSRSGTFANALPVAILPTKLVSPLELINDDLANLFDEHLVWHRLHFPYAPSLATLRKRATPKDRSSMPSLLLFAVLCELALDVPSKRLEAHRWLRPSLESIVFHYGQAALFYPPSHRDAATALELIAEYIPLALVSSQYAAPSAITGSLYIAATKRICQRSGLETTTAELRERLESGRDPEGPILDALQWINVMVLEVEIVVPLKRTPILEHFLGDEVNDTLGLLRDASQKGIMPRQAYYLFHHLVAAQRFFRTLCDIMDGWQDLSIMDAIITQHETACQEQRADFCAGLQTPLDDDDAAHSVVITTLLENDLHKVHSGIISNALFYAVMSGVYLRQQAEFRPEEVAKVSNHIIDRLREHDETDPDRHPVRRFLEKFGTPRMDELERFFTNFVGLVEGVTLRGIPYVARSRHVASELLIACKDVVENNAARLKGWGGFHDRIDTQLILFQVCARRLEDMTDTSKRENALGEGNLLSASAMLIRSLHSILMGWKKKTMDSHWQGIPSMVTGTTGPSSSGPSAATASTSGGGTTMFTPSTEGDGSDLLSGDFFADWNSWPQLDTVDFVDFLQADIDLSFGWLNT